MSVSMIVAVILSAGESRRMGRPKALLPIEGVSFIEKIVGTLRAANIARILVVLGHKAEEMRSQIGNLPVTLLVNEEYQKGQLSSLMVAIRKLQASDDAQSVDGILVHLVDHPYISATLINVMVDKFYAAQKSIVIPRYRGRRGHPVIFSRTLFSELLAAPLEEGAKAVVHAHRADTLEFDTEEEGVTIDIDTPEAYRQYVKED